MEPREMLELKHRGEGKVGRWELAIFPLFFAVTVEEGENVYLLFKRHDEVF